MLIVTSETGAGGILANDHVLRYSIPGDNTIALTDALANTIRKHFATDRENRFQLFLLAAGIRKRYLKKRGEREEYDEAFREWYQQNGMEKLFGQLPNLTKYGFAGEVIAHTASLKGSEKYLSQLPTSMRALYSASQLLNRDKRIFDICLKVHPTRKSPEDPQSEWGSANGNSPLIHPHTTSQEIDAFVEKWFSTRQSDDTPAVNKKEMLLLAKVYVSKDLFKFDKKSGKHLGGIDMPDVEAMLAELQKTLPRGKSFAVENDIPKIKKKYYRAKDKSGRASKILAKPSQRIIKKKTKTADK